MSTENCKFRIPLKMYLKMQSNDDSIAEIDVMIEGEVVAGPQNGGVK